jgi:chromosome segregation ATPase
VATQLAALELRVVPIPETQKEIENTLDAPRRISEAIENFEKQRADAEAELVRTLRKDLAAATFNVERAIEQYKAWKARDDALAAKIEIAKQLRTIIEKRIEELKTTQAEALKAVIQRKIEQLEKEAAAEQDKAALNAINRLSPGVLRGINFRAEDGGPAPASGGVPRVEILLRAGLGTRAFGFRLPANARRAKSDFLSVSR